MFAVEPGLARRTRSPVGARGAQLKRRHDGLGVDTHRPAGGYRHRHHRSRAQRTGHDEVIPTGRQAVELTGRGAEHHRVTRARRDAEGRKLTGQRIVDRKLVAEEVARAHGNPPESRSLTERPYGGRVASRIGSAPHIAVRRYLVFCGRQPEPDGRMVAGLLPGDPPGWFGRSLLPEVFLGGLVVRRSRR